MAIEIQQPYEVFSQSEPLAKCIVVRVAKGFKGKLLGMELVSKGDRTERLRFEIEVERIRGYAECF